MKHYSGEWQSLGLNDLAPGHMADLRVALADLGLSPDRLQITARIKTAALSIFERTFVVSGALSLLTLGVAGFALLTSFLVQWRARLTQLAPLWAIGVPRLRLALAEALRAVIFAGLAYLFALPLGLWLSWMLLAEINVEAFGWRLPLRIVPQEWLLIAGLTMLAALAAAALPVRRLLRMAPATLVKEFSQDG